MASLAPPEIALPAVLWVQISYYAGWRDLLLATRVCTAWLDGIRDDSAMREVYKHTSGDIALTDPLCRQPLPSLYKYFVPLRAWAGRQHILASVREAHALESALHDRALETERLRQQRRLEEKLAAARERRDRRRVAAAVAAAVVGDIGELDGVAGNMRGVIGMAGGISDVGDMGGGVGDMRGVIGIAARCGGVGDVAGRRRSMRGVIGDMAAGAGEVEAGVGGGAGDSVSGAGNATRATAAVAAASIRVPVAAAVSPLHMPRTFASIATFPAAGAAAATGPAPAAVATAIVAEHAHEEALRVAALALERERQRAHAQARLAVARARRERRRIAVAAEAAAAAATAAVASGATAASPRVVAVASVMLARSLSSRLLRGGFGDANPGRGGGSATGDDAESELRDGLAAVDEVLEALGWDSEGAGDDDGSLWHGGGAEPRG